MNYILPTLLLTTYLATASAPPVTNGLVLHLDAAAQPALRTGTPQSRAVNLQPADNWLGADGRLSAAQLVADARPVFRISQNEGFLRFDGKNDFMAVRNPGRSASNVTVFVLASPRANPGNFSSLFACAAVALNDYTSGLNFDLGPNATKELSVLNVESAGSTGFYDFLQPGKNLAAELPFGSFHVFVVRSKSGTNGNEVFLDGIRLDERARSESRIQCEEIIVGGRFYSNDPLQPPYAQGFFQGDIAAVLLYDRALDDGERQKVEQYLFARVPALNALAGGNTGHALEVLSDAPVVQILVPGFAVHELPLKLRNQTNLRYRHDGKLVALGYDGSIRLLSDSNGDGLEDSAAIFWTNSTIRAPIGMELLRQNDPRGDGMFIASKDKIVLILDKDRDGTADEEINVASGWKETLHGVDALGIAVSPKDGSVCFSIGCENFASPYLVDPADGKSGFQLSSERGTIQRVAPDLSRRETVCTGVRFACALAFNRHGDLFATDQEGATWLPNGNPLDELLHIVPGRHYGFPPRHPKHLPEVIDEPAVMEYGPQHQSTVGMVFNEGVNGGPAFGPTNWQGDALICGESRGKLYRTKLVKTAEGYVAQNHLIVCLSMLAVDACVSPRGDLLIACHSGPPDWGTGPAGDGRIFKIRYANKSAPQPVHAWASAPDEFRIAFDTPLKTEDWAGARDKMRIEAGKFVSAGDRFEVIRPGYQIVRDQMAAPRRWVEVQSLSLTADRRTLVLRVPRQTEAANYALTLPIPAAWHAPGGIEQRPEMDVALTLEGMQAAFQSDERTNRVVIPHPSLVAAEELTRGSAEHEEFFGRLKTPENRFRRLTLQAQLNVENIFVPATQPGSQLDWDIGADVFANRVMNVRQDFSDAMAREVAINGESSNRFRPVQLDFTGAINVRGSGLTFALDDRVRPISINRFRLPWAGDEAQQAPTTNVVARTDVKGRWLHGRRLFFGQATCATCHTIRGEGIVFGPDITNLIYRDRESVMHDILQPSATINPDHTGVLVKFTDGEEVNGLVRVLNNEKIVIRLPGGLEMERSRKEVAGIEPMKTSLMPEGFGQAMSPEQQEDLLTFLLTNPLEPARVIRFDPAPPPPRTRKELEPFLVKTNSQPEKLPPLRLLLVGDEKDHGVDEHDYPLWLERWSKLLALADNVTAATARGFPSRNQLREADVTVFYSRNSGWNADAAKLLDEYQQRGGGLVYLHWGIEGGKDAMALADRIGLAFSFSKFRHGPMKLEFSGVSHPITTGFTTLDFIDESYWDLRGDASRVSVLANSVEDNAARPQIWVTEHGASRTFVCIPGHYTWTFDDPLYRVLVLRGIAWAGKQANTDRFNELVTVGATATQ